MRLNALILTVGCVLLLSGCANLNPMPKESKQLQQDAIARWQQCLDRHAGKSDTSNLRIASKELRSRCEGHRRDVLMSFPATVEPQLNKLLLKHTLRSAFSPPIDGQNDFLRPLVNLPGNLPNNQPGNLPSSSAIQSAR